MSSPRHLWSGDWRTESETAAEELARRRAAAEAIADAPQPAPEQPRSSLRERLTAKLVATLAALRRGLGALGRQLAAAGAGGLAWIRGHREQVRVGLVAAVIALCTAGVAYGALSLLNGSTSNPASVVNGTEGWLGVELASTTLGTSGFPSSGAIAAGGGVLITDVIPGSPAQAAGLEPGDVLSEIDGTPVRSPAEVQAALSGFPVGGQVQLQYLQGSIVYMTQATLAKRPAGYP